LYKTHKIKIGSSSIGGDAPIRIQSMTTTNTMDTSDTVDQCIRIINAGADLVRLTVRNIREAKNLSNIQDELRKRGFHTPLIADVHFNPKIAEISARITDKVRINPGNFANKNIREKFVPLLNTCKEHQTALRIGVNHGSLSDRILKKFGDTPEGMIESAMEYLRICLKENFTDVIVSSKSSNSRVMIYSNRLLVNRMQAEGMHFPVHLGVTEAGEGEDGRIRSAIGIGTLLAEGTGDTIRVSLTEDPENEIPVAQKLSGLYPDKPETLPEDLVWDPYHFVKRETKEIKMIGGAKVPAVICSVPTLDSISEMMNDEISADFLFSSTPDHIPSIPEGISLITDYDSWQKYRSGNTNVFPVINPEEFRRIGNISSSLNFIQAFPEELNKQLLNTLKNFDNIALILIHQTTNRIQLLKAFNTLIQSGIPVPVIIKSVYSESDKDLYILKAASELGVYFTDGLADGLWIHNQNFSAAENTHLAFQILQASRARIFKTEYIACPSCGRTLFNIQDTLASVKKATRHLKHLKIAVMGCIVNGPGEMADADYGFVGSSPGKITLFKQKKAGKKNIPVEHAIDELINLIKENGDWIEK
jgi:(E)-4-hydroxy-3-methylbut-2-enyl-diphosphate synthase